MTNTLQLPRYKCHKEVRAMKIGGIQPASSGGAQLDLVPGMDGPSNGLSFLSVDVTAQWLIKHNPKIGGYYVVYEDGYSFVLPAAAFEDGYTSIRPQRTEEVIAKPPTDIEQEIQEKGRTAPRVTPQRIEDVIDNGYYFTAADGVYRSIEANFGAAPVDGEISAPLNLLTFCVLVLKNGFTVTGESACVSPENFDEEIGRKIALENAKQKIWALEGYALHNNLLRDRIKRFK